MMMMISRFKHCQCSKERVFYRVLYVSSCADVNQVTNDISVSSRRCNVQRRRLIRLHQQQQLQQQLASEIKRRQCKNSSRCTIKENTVDIIQKRKLFVHVPDHCLVKAF